MRAIFLDRDGVINENRADHVKSLREFRFLPGVLEALRLLALSNFRIFVVTNQAIVNQGVVSAFVIEQIHSHMMQIVQQHHGYIHGISYCPHRHNEQCNCRKPQPGMLMSLAQEWQIDLPNAYLVGDALTDIAAGQAVGCRSVLVQTGRGRAQAALPEAARYRPNHIALDLPDAVRWVLEQEGLTLPGNLLLRRDQLVIDHMAAASCLV